MDGWVLFNFKIMGSCVASVYPRMESPVCRLLLSKQYAITHLPPENPNNVPYLMHIL